MTFLTNLSLPIPMYVGALKKVYGPPSQAGFGSAVFFELLAPEADLEQAALRHYRYFVGNLWDRYGEAAWMEPWKQVYTRPPGVKADIVAEMGAIAHPTARLSIPLLLAPSGDRETAQKALSKVYDDAAVTELNLYNLGDGAVVSGLLIAGRRQNGETTFLVFLLD
jgi:hypothetical protein